MTRGHPNEDHRRKNRYNKLRQLRRLVRLGLLETELSPEQIPAQLIAAVLDPNDPE